MKIDFKTTGGPYGDATSNYEIIFPKGTTVREFVKYIVDDYSVKHGEWGDIHLGSVLGEKLISYSRGKLTGVGLNFDKYIDRKITKIRANGGWSCMYYFLLLEEEEKK